MEIRVNTNGYGGRTLHKTATVITNDPNNPEVKLEISGPVKYFAVIKPAVIQLRGDEGKEISGTATIMPVEAYPFKIIRTSATANAAFTHTLEEFQEGDKTGWRLTVKDQDPKGRYSGVVYLHTDSKEKSSLEVKVYGNFTKKRPTTQVSQMPPKGEK
ncbi:MAG: hypothetical protein JEZ02_04290 [Desulfatibacillum sp.]|nr:hypothetical protein [Desulfatibacillum sp.]